MIYHYYPSRTSDFPNTATSTEIASPLTTGSLKAQHLNVNLVHNYFLTHPSQLITDYSLCPAIWYSAMWVKINCPHARHEDICGNGGRRTCIPNLDTARRYMVIFTPWLPIPQGKTHCYSLTKKVGEPLSWYRYFGQEKNLFPWRELNHNSLDIQPETQSLSSLCYPSSPGYWKMHLKKQAYSISSDTV
jgi:hypothetical protein